MRKRGCSWQKSLLLHEISVVQNNYPVILRTRWESFCTVPCRSAPNFEHFLPRKQECPSFPLSAMHWMAWQETLICPPAQHILETALGVRTDCTAAWKLRAARGVRPNQVRADPHRKKQTGGLLNTMHLSEYCMGSLSMLSDSGGQSAVCWWTFTPWAEMLKNQTIPKPNKLKKWLPVLQSAKIPAVIWAGGLWSGQRLGVGLTRRRASWANCNNQEVAQISRFREGHSICLPGPEMDGQT